jgi:hypothetical protein
MRNKLRFSKFREDEPGFKLYRLQVITNVHMNEPSVSAEREAADMDVPTTKMNLKTMSATKKLSPNRKLSN